MIAARIRWWLADRLRPNVWPSTASQHAVLLEEIRELRGVVHSIAFSDSEPYPPTAQQLRDRAFRALRES